MKTSKLTLFMLIAVISFGCDLGSDDDTPAIIVKIPGGVLSGNIKTDRTLSADSIYVIKGFTYVNSGATLTIPAGTIIKGEKASKACLVVEQGAKIIADGTAQKPIIFTSDQPIRQRSYGDWGGLVLIGKAPHSLPPDTPFEGNIRGTFGAFNDVNDNSGVLRYVRIEFGGVALTSLPDSEINGLSLYGVGAGTVIDYVQVSYAGDDAYEWFGGTVNLKHLVALGNFDDDFDVDFGYTGKVQYAVSLRDVEVADLSGANGFESNNYLSEVVTGGGMNGTGTNHILTQPVFSNVSIFAFKNSPSSTITPRGSGSYQAGIYLRGSTALSVLNSVIVGYPEGLHVEDSSAFKNANEGKMDLRGTVLANMGQNYRAGTGVSVDAIKNFFETASKGNLNANIDTLGLNTANFNLTAPNFMPTATSILLSGAKFDVKGAGLEPVAYRGAFGITDWTAGWTNFDPQTTDYSK